MKFCMIFLSFIFLGIPSFSQNQDSLLLKRVLSELQLTANDVHMELVLHQVLSYSTDKTIFVIPTYSAKEQDEYQHRFYEFDAHILIADNKNGIILNEYYEPKAWTSDAVSLISIQIDTIPYILNKKTTALGLRVEYQGSSKPNPYRKTDFSLFIPEQHSLKRVLKDFPIAEFYGEWDTSCSGEFEASKSSIDIDKKKNNAFYNLMVRTTVRKTQNLLSNNDCIEKEKISHSLSELTYNGESYQ
jgi:hypothetical protein